MSKRDEFYNKMNRCFYSQYHGINHYVKPQERENKFKFSSVIKLIIKLIIGAFMIFSIIATAVYFGIIDMPNLGPLNHLFFKVYELIDKLMNWLIGFTSIPDMLQSGSEGSQFLMM